MKVKNSFRLILKSKPFILASPFKHLTDISKDISDSLIFGSNHSYQVKSNVSEENFQLFIEYLVNDEVPDINLNNINDFIELSQEFVIMQDEISRKKDEYGDFLIHINNLLSEQHKDKSKSEEFLSSHLDEYIENHSQILMKLSIQKLYNIFNHKSRKLTNHDLAYKMIKQHYSETNDSNIFILLESLDGSEMSRRNLDESITQRKNHCNYMPNIDFTYLKTIQSNQQNHEIQIKNLENQLKQQREEMKSNIKNHEETAIELFKGIENQYIKELKSFQSSFQKYQEETEIKIKNQEEKIKQQQQEIERLIDENRMKNFNHTKYILKLDAKYAQEIKNLHQKITLITNEINTNKQSNKNQIKLNESNQESKINEFIESNSSSILDTHDTNDAHNPFGTNNKTSDEGNSRNEIEIYKNINVTLQSVNKFSGKISYMKLGDCTLSVLFNQKANCYKIEIKNPQKIFVIAPINKDLNPSINKNSILIFFPSFLKGKVDRRNIVFQSEDEAQRIFNYINEIFSKL